MADLEALEAQALKLSSDDRAKLLDRLILSLDHDQVRDEAWAALATERAAGLGSGQVVALDGPETVVRLRAKFA